MMNTELFVVVCGCVFGVIHIMAAGRAKTRQYGTSWNMGARDEDLPPPQPLVGRLMRAQANYFETFPIAASALLVVTVAELTSVWTSAGAIVWLLARMVYLPLYAAGVPKVRTLVFLLSLLGILVVLGAAFMGIFQESPR
jgi:uncharacterized MAPEG superfamily protein